MKKWKILTFVFMFLFIAATFYGVVFTLSVIDRWENRTAEISLLEPRLRVGSVQLAQVLREELGINSWKNATVIYRGDTFKVTVDTGEEVLIVSGSVSRYEEWEITSVGNKAVEK